MKKKIGMVLLGLMVIVLIVVGCYFLVKKYNSKELDSGDFTDFVKVTNNDKKLGSYKLLYDEENANAYFVNTNEYSVGNKVLTTYYCQTSECKVLATYHSTVVDSDEDIKIEPYILIKDNYYYLYNYENLTQLKLNLSEKNYDSFDLLISDDKVYGLALVKETEENEDEYYSVGYYSVKSQKTIFNTILSEIYGKIFFDVERNILIENCVVRDINTGEKIQQFEAQGGSDSCLVDIISNKNDIYYLVYDFTGVDVFKTAYKLYDSKYNLLDEDIAQGFYNENSAIYYIKSDSEILLREDKSVSTYINGVRSSKAKNYEEIYLILDNYFVGVENGYLKLFDIAGNTIENLMKWDYSYSFRTDYCSYSPQKDIYLYVEDEDFKGYKFHYSIGSQKVEKTEFTY